MTRGEAQRIALTVMEMSGKPVVQMWTELREAAGHRPTRRPQRPTWSDVHDWVTNLVIDAATERMKLAPHWVLVVVEREMRRHG